jgi:hypothetical protein
MVTDRHTVDTVPTDVAMHLGVDSDHLNRHGVHRCSVQWSVDPIGRGRIAIGDAALALNPLAGQGVRFALASTLAAAAVIRSWADGCDDHYIDSYYRTFIADLRTRHLATLNAIFDSTASPETPEATRRLDPQSAVSFTATEVTTGQNRGGRIVAEQAFELPDGGLTRYVGGVDLMDLQDATAHCVTLAEVYRALADKLGPQTADTLISWALRQGVLAVSQRPRNTRHAPGLPPDRRVAPTG